MNRPAAVIEAEHEQRRTDILANRAGAPTVANQPDVAAVNRPYRTPRWLNRPGRGARYDFHAQWMRRVTVAYDRDITPYHGGPLNLMHFDAAMTAANRMASVLRHHYGGRRLSPPPPCD